MKIPTETNPPLNKEEHRKLLKLVSQLAGKDRDDGEGIIFQQTGKDFYLRRRKKPNFQSLAFLIEGELRARKEYGDVAESYKKLLELLRSATVRPIEYEFPSRRGWLHVRTLISVFLECLWWNKGNFEYDNRIFNRFYDSWISSIFEPIKWQRITPIWNCTFDIKVSSLSPNVSLRPPPPEVLRCISNSANWLPSSCHWFSHVLRVFVSETVKKGKGFPAEERFRTSLFLSGIDEAMVLPTFTIPTFPWRLIPSGEATGCPYSFPSFSSGHHRIVKKDEILRTVRNFKKLEKASKSIILASKRLVRSVHGRAPEDAIIDSAIGLESLWLCNIEAELKYRFSLHGAFLLSKIAKEMPFSDALQAIKIFYDVRSKIVHGSSPRSQKKLQTHAKHGKEWLSLSLQLAVKQKFIPERLARRVESSIGN